MEIHKTINGVRQLVRSWKKANLTVGVVPTMGFLHEGHASLIKRAKAENDRVVATIFVNPTQFGPNEDLATYPRDWDHDVSLCEKLGVDSIFNPEPAEMYPSPFFTEVEVPELSLELCGASRPGHFKGVCLVVTKLFHITEPHKAYFGLKDAQQYFILKRLAADLNLDVTLVPCPIVREPDGLALSSRNSYLNPVERQAATVLNKALTAAKEAIDKGERNVKTLLDMIADIVAGEPLAKLDYVQAVETVGLTPVTRIEGECLVAAAMWMGKTRLIDNFVYLWRKN
ncbi:MAG: pantoate--beta-alanine ligase [Deltaproteobacteria bacterium]|jgi:pantoate--beta-alanine ligase|nr:pantoate--beta-alanine ligase [Deltaproteobacteria bacterium]